MNKIPPIQIPFLNTFKPRPETEPRPAISWDSSTRGVRSRGGGGQEVR